LGDHHSTVEHSWTTFHAELEKVGKFHEQLASKAEELVLTLDNWVKEKEKTKIKVGLLHHPPPPPHLQHCRSGPVSNC
jgi:hypothetical protein